MIHSQRRPGPLLALYGALAAAWAAFALWAVPSIIEAAYHGRSIERFNRFFQGRTPHPLDHYVQLWNDFAAAVLIAEALHLAFVLYVRRLDVGRANRLLIGFAGAFLGVTVLAWVRHDYAADLEIWDVVLRGGDPWWLLPEKGVPLHAYGPLFNALAIPRAINPMLPKLLCSFAYLATVAWLARGGWPRWGLVAWVVNPFPWVEVAYFGHWDILVAVACVAAVHARSRGRDVAAGAWLASGILLKYLPLVILPFLVVEGRRVRVRLLLAAVVTTAAGLALSGLVWGSSTFRPLTYGASRPSTLLSVFRFLRGAYSPLGWFSNMPNADALATPCLALAGLGVFAWCWARRVGPAAGSTLAVLTTLLFYRVGFPQYQVVLLVLASYWIVSERNPGRDPFLAIALGLYFGWLALFDVFYALVGGVLHPGDRFAWTEEVVGLPTFLLGGLLLVAISRRPGPETGPA